MEPKKSNTQFGIAPTSTNSVLTQAQHTTPGGTTLQGTAHFGPGGHTQFAGHASVPVNESTRVNAGISGSSSPESGPQITGGSLGITKTFGNCE